MSDLIDRQAAIRIAEQGQIQGFEWQIRKLLGMPSAEPEVIRCKDCKYWISDGCKEVGCLEDDFCSYAERRGEQE